MAASEVIVANREGWRVAWVAFVVAVFGWGVGFYGPAVYLQSLHQAQGWSISTVSSAVSAHFLVSAILITWLPDAYRRFGVGRVTFAGALLAASGAAAWGHAHELWQIGPAVLLSAAGWAATSGAALNAIVSPWFTSNRPRAISLAFNGASVGGVAFVPLWMVLITRFGLGGATTILGALMVAVLCPLARAFLWESPGAKTIDLRQAAATTRGRLMRMPRFLTLSAAFALGLFAQIGMFAHLIARLTPPLGPSLAAAAVSLTTICAIFGRVLVGRLIGGRDARLLGAASLVTQAIGTSMLAFGAGLAQLTLGCVLFGLGVGNLVSLPPVIAQREFCAVDVGTVVALVTAMNQALFAFAPVVLGWLKDSTHDYLVPFALAAAVQVLAAIVVAGGRSRP
ncbi:Predicted arabinose efflux permease, MFS family [Enhydrobacter aerosaccus]|uniref:Predicted arabinose efflux permease, MFS family n=1 Tax=Enhydrobacter aerosaccus TaxID=225324 RepID=A0A1T4RJN4_9HYPH|nr:MFS transporter [Enhydrobacter aerosaccus]SKA15986.1 Predicted arabinose efflux permease, MFS family [Enhydrobacter aerosaccus]